jgi:hypothetical protein
MSYNANVPIASQTPSLFPAQGSANFTVLKTLIGRDHIFNNTVVAGDNSGCHKQVTLINRSNPVALPGGTNAMLFSQKTAPNASQLMYWDGTIFNQLTPVGFVVPLLITGKLALAAGASTVIFNNPGYKYVGTAIGLAQGTQNTAMDLLTKEGVPNSVSSLIKFTGTLAKTPSFFYAGTENLSVKNQDSVPRVIQWSLTINKSP